MREVGEENEGKRKNKIKKMEEKWTFNSVQVRKERECEKSQGRKWGKKEKKIKNKNKNKMKK